VDALWALDDADRRLGEYDMLLRTIQALSEKAEAAGLKLPASVSEQPKGWDFPSVRLQLGEAGRAVDAYVEASERVDGSPSLWERLGLIGRSPENQVRLAAQDFAAGNFVKSTERSSDASQTMSGASGRALQYLLAGVGVLAMTAAAIGAGIWLAGRREREFAEL
jgi:hypothetical protein